MTDDQQHPQIFRVHFEDDTKVDIVASNAGDAREKAKARHDGLIRKIKRNREKTDE